MEIPAPLAETSESRDLRELQAALRHLTTFTGIVAARLESREYERTRKQRQRARRHPVEVAHTEAAGSANSAAA